jgi:hypothetical protein
VSLAADAIDVAASVIAGLAKVVPAVAAWAKPALDANPEHPISKRVAEILPAEGASAAALREIER